VKFIALDLLLHDHRGTFFSDSGRGVMMGVYVREVFRQRDDVVVLYGHWGAVLQR